MTAIAWILIIGGVLLLRAAFKGQVFNADGEFVLVEKLGNVVEAFITGDNKKLDALANDPSGGINAPTKPVETPDPTSGILKTDSGNVLAAASLLSAAIKRGQSAKGYRFAATGPDWYDCSGLVWRAMQDAYHGYKRPRFTSHVMLLPPWSQDWKRVSTPQVGDIVLWRNHHTGIVSGPDKFYSARNPRSGIGHSSISGWKGQGAPIFLRVTL